MKTKIEFTNTPIVVPPQIFSSKEIGAALEFSGIVRELEHDSKIPGLNYEAHEAMARKELKKILSELSAKHPCDEILFIHRLGFVPVGEASLFIRINAGHRQAALALMAELIDRLKQDVPVWKSSADFYAG
jgi:molybdopterin synthase catalytic subunit